MSLARQEAAWRKQVAENSARLAQVHVMYDTHGWGEFQEPERFDFGLTFLDEPTVSYGYSVNGDKLVAKRFPRAWGGVYQWDDDSRGYFVGCWCFMVVDTISAVPMLDAPAADPGYDLKHYFTFSGVAIKDLPDEIMD